MKRKFSTLLCILVGAMALGTNVSAKEKTSVEFWKDSFGLVPSTTYKGF